MARSLGGGGGSHSFGGGGSRSFGGSHSGGSRSFGGFHASSSGSSTRRVSSGGSSYHHSSGSYYGGGLPPRPPRYGRSYYRRGYSGPVIINNGGGAPVGGGSGCGGGCLTTFLWVFLITAILGIIFSVFRMNNGSPSSYTTSNSSGYGCTKYTGEVDKSHGYWEDHSVGDDCLVANGNQMAMQKKDCVQRCPGK